MSTFKYKYVKIKAIKMAALKQKIYYTIRSMEDNDIPQVLDIDREAFPTQWPFPTYSSFKQELRNKLAHYIVAFKPNYDSVELKYMNQEDSRNQRTIFSRLRNLFTSTPENNYLPPPARDLIIGMAGIWMMVGEAHIITIAVRNAFRRLGIGEGILISVIERSLQLQANIVTLEVRISNIKAQQLYKKYGFDAVGIRQKYYTDNNENALIMSTENIKLPSFQSRFQLLKKAHEETWGPSTG